MMQFFDIQWHLSEHGLLAGCDDSETTILVGKPFSIKGRAFEDYDEPSVTAIYNTSFKTNAPLLEIKITGKGRKTRYHLDMSLAYAPGPMDKVWFRQTYKDVDKMLADVIDLFLGSDDDREKIMANDIPWSDT